MLDTNLAALYGVKTKYINQQVNRNIGRFPERFMFRLSVSEKDELVANCNRFSSLKHSVVMPRAFTEHGVSAYSRQSGQGSRLCRSAFLLMPVSA